MAKTTRKTEPTTAVTKPAARTTKAAAPAASAGKATARRKTPTAPEPTHDEIALRAWSIYQQRGASHGQAMSDWLEAKAQLCLERGLKL